MESKQTDQVWNALFSSLALAEEAAARECRKVAARFIANDQPDRASEYLGLADEEDQHHRLALSVAREFIPITDRAKIIYAGGYFTDDGSVLECLMSVHLVFEPSALAFLGFIARNANKLIQDKTWASEIQNAFGLILRDEVSHVINGCETIRQVWNEASRDDKKLALKTMRKHRAFLKAGLRSVLKDGVERSVIDSMLRRFDFYCKKSLKGVLDGETIQASA